MQTHVSYETYLQPELLKMKEEAVDDERNDHAYFSNKGRHFAMYERREAKTVMNRSSLGESRYFGPMYAKSLPLLSDDQ